MIIGIGTDIVAVHRFESWLKKDGFLERFFHPDELSYARSCGKGQCESIAARFAAKEAFGKALGIGLVGIQLKDIAVMRRQGEKPTLALFGSAQQKAEQNHVRSIHLSLSHEKDYALAMVVLEG
ncbi:MAG: holo-ACP synthase [Spirochaetaceae bacterium]|jgi:holo-[acyl-carrier protein] synthase|nr:holo-ACP synthase [Spirochaetaceae bacterium]